MFWTCNTSFVTKDRFWLLWPCLCDLEESISYCLLPSTYLNQFPSFTIPQNHSFQTHQWTQNSSFYTPFTLWHLLVSLMLVNVTNIYAVPQVQIPEFIHFLFCILSSVNQKAFLKKKNLKHIPNIPTSSHFHCTSFQPWSLFTGSPIGAFHFISASTLICHRRQPNASPLESVPLTIFGKDLPISKPNPESIAWPSWTSDNLIKLYLFCFPMPPMHPLLLW